MRHEDVGVADEGHDIVRLTHILLETVERGLGIAMFHRNIRPGQVLLADIEFTNRAACADCRLEDIREHKTVTYDCDRRHQTAAPSRTRRSERQTGRIALRVSR